MFYGFPLKLKYKLLSNLSQLQYLYDPRTSSLLCQGHQCHFIPDLNFQNNSQKQYSFLFVLKATFRKFLNHQSINQVRIIYSNLRISYKMVNPLTVEEQRKAWTIYRSLTGITYYYNRATKKSQYQMPQCFKTTQEKLEHPEWKEYRTAEGKKFYYNSKTAKSVWQLPNEVKQWRIKMQQQQRLQAEDQKRREEGGLLNINDQNKKKIKQLMKEKHIDITKKWDDCRNICKEDPRWQLISNMQDKKALFFQYISELRKTEDKQKKIKLDRLKASFLKMLMDSTYLNSDCKLHKVTILFAGDQRWKDLDQEQRQNVFQSYMDELYNKQKEQARQKKKFYMDALGKEMESRSVHYRMRWDQFKQAFSQSTNYVNLNNIDRLNRFVEYILDAEKKNQQEQLTQKMNQQRINRENFREMLISKLRDGKIDHKTRWPAFVKENVNQQALFEMMDPDQKGSSAHQLFQDLMQGIREHHKTFKSLIKQYFKLIGFKITPQTQQQEFQKKLQGLNEFWNLRTITRDYFFFYFKNKIKGKNSRKGKKVLMKLFKNMKQIKPRTSYYEVSSKIKSQLKSNPIPEEVIRKYFDKYLKEIDDKKRKRSKSRESKSRNSSSSSSNDRKKRKKRQKSSSKSSSSDNQRNKSLKKIKREQKVPSKGKQQQKRMEEQKNLNDHEQEGEIRDSDAEIKHKKKSHKSKHKKRKRSSSSQSD